MLDDDADNELDDDDKLDDDDELDDDDDDGFSSLAMTPLRWAIGAIPHGVLIALGGGATSPSVSSSSLLSSSSLESSSKLPPLESPAQPPEPPAPPYPPAPPWSPPPFCFSEFPAPPWSPPPPVFQISFLVPHHFYQYLHPLALSQSPQALFSGYTVSFLFLPASSPPDL